MIIILIFLLGMPSTKLTRLLIPIAIHRTGCDPKQPPPRSFLPNSCNKGVILNPVRIASILDTYRGHISTTL
ncbi:hypothetical protein V1506DRAFT_545948 [Lipomyces tetrasporus]